MSWGEWRRVILKLSSLLFDGCTVLIELERRMAEGIHYSKTPPFQLNFIHHSKEQTQTGAAEEPSVLFLFQFCTLSRFQLHLQ